MIEYWYFDVRKQNEIKIIVVYNFTQRAVHYMTQHAKAMEINCSPQNRIRQQ